MSPAGRKPPTGRKSNAPPTRDDKSPREKKVSPEMRKTAEQNIARAKALEVLYRPFHDAAKGELQKTAPGRALIEEMNAFAREIDELSKGITSQNTTRGEVGFRVRERLKKFRDWTEATIREICLTSVG